jgi:Ca2+-binding EF-hand superfamily protein
VYDQDEDGLISAEELYELLHSFLGSSYSDHQLQTVVQATMRQVGDGTG